MCLDQAARYLSMLRLNVERILELIIYLFYLILGGCVPMRNRLHAPMQHWRCVTGHMSYRSARMFALWNEGMRSGQCSTRGIDVPSVRG